MAPVAPPVGSEGDLGPEGGFGLVLSTGPRGGIGPVTVVRGWVRGWARGWITNLC